MKLLIQSIPGDVHAIAVAVAAGSRGHHVTLWSSPDFPNSVQTTVEFGSNGGDWKIGQTQLHRMNSVDLVWWRRYRSPRLAPGLHKDDQTFAFGESRHFYRGLLTGVAHSAKWLHSPAASEAAESKISQLAHAQENGLKIPRTIFSNDPTSIRRFIEDVESSGGSVIYKTFGPGAWVHGTGGKTMFAKRVRASDLEHDSVISAVPGIYQESIPKRFEVRATMFGDRPVAARINSQSDPSASDDWRASLQLGEILEPLALPEEVATKCRSLMKILSIDMACFDFIVTPDGDYVFLELNQQGQFLWVEELCESICMLDEFVSFLERANSPHKPPSSGKRMSFNETVSSPQYAEYKEIFDTHGYVNIN